MIHNLKGNMPFFFLPLFSNPLLIKNMIAMKKVIEHNYRIYLIDKINALLIRFTGNGLNEEELIEKMNTPLEELEKEYNRKVHTHNMYPLGWN